MTITIRTKAVPRPRRADGDGDDTHVWRSRMDDRAVPVWVHRMHADALPTGETPSRAWVPAESQRFVERWGRATSGY